MTQRIYRRKQLTAPLSVLFRPEDLADLRAEAARYGYPVSEWVRECIQAGRSTVKDRLRKRARNVDGNGAAE